LIESIGTGDEIDRADKKCKARRLAL